MNKLNAEEIVHDTIESVKRMSHNIQDIVSYELDSHTIGHKFLDTAVIAVTVMGGEVVSTNIIGTEQGVKDFQKQSVKDKIKADYNKSFNEIIEEQEDKSAKESIEEILDGLLAHWDDDNPLDNE